MKKAFTFALASLAGCVATADGIPSAMTGVWAARAEWCQNAAEIGTAERAPIRITETTFYGIENRCEVESVTQVSDRTVKVATTCFSEGYEYTEKETLSLQTDGSLFLTDEMGGTVRFVRCKL